MAKEHNRKVADQLPHAVRCGRFIISVNGRRAFPLAGHKDPIFGGYGDLPEVATRIPQPFIPIFTHTLPNVLMIYSDWTPSRGRAK